MTANLKNKVVIVTGTSSGIGLQMATLLAKQGHRVYAGTLTPELDQAIPGVISHYLDVSNDEAVETFVNFVAAKEERIDGLINNAGYGAGGAIEETPMIEAQKIMDVNFFGAVRMCKACIPLMRRQGAGHILNVSSGAGFTAAPFTGFYSASKYALEGYTESLRLELWHQNIKVVLLEPGWVSTKVVENGVRLPNNLSVYTKQLDITEELIKDFCINGLDAEYAASVMIKPLSLKQPKWRYRVGKDVNSSFWFRRFLPSKWFEYLIRSYYKLNY